MNEIETAVEFIFPTAWDLSKAIFELCGAKYTNLLATDSLKKINGHWTQKCGF
jgi:hypothetical protein